MQDVHVEKPSDQRFSTYIVTISIGSPLTNYPLQLDLASSDILLASTLCGKSCPPSKGTVINPYYDVMEASSGFIEVNGNETSWNASFADRAQASGFIARELVSLGGVVIEGQVLGTHFDVAG